MIIGLAVAYIGYRLLKPKKPAPAPGIANAPVPVQQSVALTTWHAKPDITTPLLAAYWPIKILAVLAFKGRCGLNPALAARILFSVFRPERLLAEITGDRSAKPVLRLEGKAADS